MSLEKASGRPWVGPGGMEDRTVPFIPEYGCSDGENECVGMYEFLRLDV